MSIPLLFAVLLGASAAHAAPPESFLATEATWPNGTGGSWEHFECSNQGGKMVRERPQMFAAGRGNKLEAATLAKVKAACDASLPLLAKGTPDDIDQMMRILYPAVAELPENRLQWHAYGWLSAHIGEGYWRWLLQTEPGDRRTELTQRAMVAFEDAVRSPGGFPNLWVHLRMGQLALEMGNRERALDELTRAYMGGQRKLFEHEDPKYMKLLESVLKPPPGMDRLP